MILAEFFNGLVISGEHLVMVILGGIAAWVLKRRLGKIDDRVRQLEARLRNGKK